MNKIGIHYAYWGSQWKIDIADLSQETWRNIRSSAQNKGEKKLWHA